MNLSEKKKACSLTQNEKETRNEVLEKVRAVNKKEALEW